MERSIKEMSVAEVMNRLSEILEVEVTMLPDAEQKLYPNWDAGNIIGKILGLYVYNGWNVSPGSMPPYNQVHANIEYWKKRFETIPQSPEPVKESTPPPDGA